MSVNFVHGKRRLMIKGNNDLITCGSMEDIELPSKSLSQQTPTTLIL
jgi:hypothetical protein